jgi:hypothetical protein
MRFSYKQCTVFLLACLVYMNIYGSWKGCSVQPYSVKTKISQARTRAVLAQRLSVLYKNQRDMYLLL